MTAAITLKWKNVVLCTCVGHGTKYMFEAIAAVEESGRDLEVFRVEAKCIKFEGKKVITRCGECSADFQKAIDYFLKRRADAEFWLANQIPTKVLSDCTPSPYVKKSQIESGEDNFTVS